MADVRKYWIKQSWIFNLESMQDKLACIGYDIEDGKLQFPLEIIGRQIKDFDELDAFREECGELEWRAKSGKVTGKEFGRIKAIVNWRVNVRYAVCLAHGMSEAEAGRCFAEM